MPCWMPVNHGVLTILPPPPHRGKRVSTLLKFLRNAGHTRPALPSYATVGTVHAPPAESDRARLDAGSARAAARLAGQSALEPPVLEDLLTRYRALAAAGLAANLYRRTCGCRKCMPPGRMR
jgi:hypothetical protein